MEDGDIDNKGHIINPKIPINKPVLVMVQAGWCPHCTHAKPAFQEFANQYKDEVFCATIEADGERKSEKDLAKRINVIIPDFKGFPDYVLFINGKPQSKKVEGRSVIDLEKFVFF